MTSLSTSRKIQDTLGRNVRDLRISVTDRCNFRCPYCMPAEIFGERYEFLKREEILSFEEIVRLTRIFIGFGVTKIRITGGEPLSAFGCHVTDPGVGFSRRRGGSCDDH